MSFFGYKFHIHKTKHLNSEWYNYIKPRQMTLKGGAPIYKWLWWIIANDKKVKEWEYYKRVANQQRERRC